MLQIIVYRVLCLRISKYYYLLGVGVWSGYGGKPGQFLINLFLDITLVIIILLLVQS